MPLTAARGCAHDGSRTEPRNRLDADGESRNVTFAAIGAAGVIHWSFLPVMEAVLLLVAVACAPTGGPAAPAILSKYRWADTASQTLSALVGAARP